MRNSPETKVVFIGDIAFNKDITPADKKTSVGGAAYYCVVGALAASQAYDLNSQVIGVVATVGSDFPLDTLLSKKISTKGIKVVTDGKTCQFTLTQYPNGSRDFKAERGVAQTVDTTTFPVDFDAAEFIHLATSLPKNYLLWMDALEKRTKALISADAFEAFAKEFPDLTVNSLNRSKMMFLNTEEQDILRSEKNLPLRTDIPRVLKKGPNGVSYINKKKNIAIAVPAPTVEVVDTTGAGDTLAGAFLILTANGFSTQQALEYAVKIASKSVTQFGVEHLIN